VAFEVDDLQAAVDRLAADGDGLVGGRVLKSQVMQAQPFSVVSMRACKSRFVGHVRYSEGQCMHE
jgi:hypothetical protein